MHFFYFSLLLLQYITRKLPVCLVMYSSRQTELSWITSFSTQKLCFAISIQIGVITISVYIRPHARTRRWSLDVTVVTDMSSAAGSVGNAPVSWYRSSLSYIIKHSHYVIGLVTTCLALVCKLPPATDTMVCSSWVHLGAICFPYPGD